MRKYINKYKKMDKIEINKLGVNDDEQKKE